VKYRKLGSSSLDASEIGFGCWEVGGEYGTFDKKQFIDAVNQALDIGVNLFDTAWGYGHGASESLLAEALGSRRDDAIICTKIGIYRHEDGSFYRDSSRSRLLDTVDRSLQALKTDFVDLLLIHWPDRDRPYDEPMETLLEIVSHGKARFIGVSNFSSSDLRKCAALAPVTVNQVGYNLFDRRWEREMFPTAEELGVSIMAYGPLAHGLLAEEIRPDANFSGVDWRRKGLVFGQALFEGANLEANVRVVAELAAIARSLDISLPQLALAWTLRGSVVGTSLTGVRTPAEIVENAAASSIQLDEDVLQRIERAMLDAAGLTTEIPL
jgi:aryl-alcohol dehydrogenase-like predicted oxidoreductase